MAQKRGLGRGLEALIPSAGSAQSTVRDLPIAELENNPFQPRKHFDAAALEGLASTIREHGILTPVVARRVADGFQIIAGERRIRAARLAGLTRVPTIVKEANDAQALEMALVENLQRADLNALEEAAAFKQLMDEFGLTQDQVSRRVGKSRAAVGNAVRLLKLPQPVKARLADGAITEGHARALMSLENEALMVKALAAVTRNAMSVRQTEEMVRRILAGPKAKVKKAMASAETRSLEDRFRRALGTKVNLFKSRKGGKVVIHFYSDEEFDAIYRRIIGKD